MQDPRLNEGPAAGIERVQCVRHPHWRQHDRRCKPDCAKPEVEPTIEASERAGFRIVNATKTVGLHHPMPDAPEKNNQDDSFEVPPVKGDTGH